MSQARDFDERIIGINWWHGGYHSVSREVEKITFTPDQFPFNYKGATISGPLSGVSVETQILIDGEEADCDQD